MAGLLLVVLLASCSSEDEGTRAETTETPTLEAPSASPSVVAIDPSVIATLDDFEEEADDVISLDGFGDFITVAGGYLWVGNAATESVDRIDLETNEIVGTTPGPLSCTDMGAGFGSLWIPSCSDATVYRIDLKTAKVTAKIKVDNVFEETAVGVGEGGVWLITDDGLLSRIDPATNKLAETLQVEPNSAGVDVGFGSVWVTSNREGVVQRIDPKKGRAVATIPVGLGPRFLSIGEDAVWTASQSVGTVSRIDPDTNRWWPKSTSVTSSTAGTSRQGAVYVWAATGRGPLSVIDQATNTVIRQWEAHGADGLALDGPTTWISDHDLQVIYRYKLP